MRRWKPYITNGRWLVSALLIISIVAVGFSTSQIATIFKGPPELWDIRLNLFWWTSLTLLLILAVIALAYRTAATFTLTYELDRNGLYIIWLGNRAVVPLDQITSLDVGIDIDRMPFLSRGGIGYYQGQATSHEGRIVHLFTTQSPERCLVIHANDASYAISPADQESFIQDLEQRRNLGSTKPLASAIQPGRMFLYAFWNDSPVRLLLVLALLINLLTLAALSIRYPTLAPILAMRFDPQGQGIDLRPRYQILSIPLAAFGLTLVNTILGIALYPSQQLSARLLQGASLTIQALFAIALFTIMR